jgi:hypothetical protein
MLRGVSVEEVVEFAATCERQLLVDIVEKVGCCESEMPMIQSV